jgi:hypothetical protein
MGFWAIFFAPFTTFCTFAALTTFWIFEARVAVFRGAAGLADLAGFFVLSFATRFSRVSPDFIVPSYSCNVALFQFGDIKRADC